MNLQHAVRLLNIFPTIFAIYLVLISNTQGNYWKRRISSYFLGKEKMKELADHIDVITYVSLDWNSRNGFFNSLITSILSAVISLYLTRNPGFLTLIIIELFLLPVAFSFVEGFNPGELTSVTNIFLSRITRGKIHIRQSTILSIILVFIFLVQAICQYIIME